ncbi:MAG: PEP/pyruvate-binding domain-containing protein [Kiritimatiellia bacterium]
MDWTQNRPTTGLPGLDSVLKGILPGDNIVWQMDRIEHYRELVVPFASAARSSGRRLVYFRFASGPPLLSGDDGARVCEARPADGFETFIAEIHAVIKETGRGAVYVFDCLSELAADWFSDQMLGNFFMLTCPYLYDMETVTYFALLRNYHSSMATRPIQETTQLLLETYSHGETIYIHPLKVHLRYSPTMNMLHAWKGDEFVPVTNSALISEVLAATGSFDLHSRRKPGFWERTFMEARELEKSKNEGTASQEAREEMFKRLVRMLISREENVVSLVSRYFDLTDILKIRRRMIGTGLIGGKTVGMLAARKILENRKPGLSGILEDHDSFYVGSDVFYTFLVRNGVWWVRQQQRSRTSFLEGAEQARQGILTGAFPEYIVDQFEQMLDYFGQSPIIVRSSSLLEDNFGNSFAGKYDSVFCPNQGPRERRLEDFLSAVRAVYASTMSEKALRYRERRGLLQQDEQMALLIMRVSGSTRSHRYFPESAGVGFSFNPYAWSEEIDPRAGVVRLVFGLGTRAVERTDDDYTRVVALNAPEKRPETGFDQVCRYAQRRVDFLDLHSNQLASGDFDSIARDLDSATLDLFASRQAAPGRLQGETANPPWILTFDGLLKNTPIVRHLREMLAALEKAYSNPVDIEFTVNFVQDGTYRVNLVQCRPLQVRSPQMKKLPDVATPRPRTVARARGAVIGHSRIIYVSRLVYVVPEAYGRLPLRERSEVARLIGRINYALAGPFAGESLFLGPGRWGTASPELGIPVNFAEINRANAVCEIVAMRKDLVPDVSLGTHFLSELVEMDVLYMALFPGEDGNFIDEKYFTGGKNMLREIVPGSEKWQDVVKVVFQPSSSSGEGRFCLHADAAKQTAVCFLEPEA